MNRVQLEHTDVFLRCHDPEICKDEDGPCTVHRRSDHHMRSYPQNWRGDKGLMERICPHGIGHPDPDEVFDALDGRNIHGCDGCCAPPDDE